MDLIEKWKKKYINLLYEYNRTKSMMTEREICECLEHQKTISQLIKDLEQLKNENTFNKA